MTECLYAVCFPELAAADARLLADLRARYHPAQAGRIGPHFTFVFALPVSVEGALATQVRQVAAVTATIAFTLRRVTPIADKTTGRAYITLVPHRGHLAMIELHRALHGGGLEPYREPAVRFEPHLTVGLFETADESVSGTADSIAAEIHGACGNEGIAGRLTDLSIVAETTDAIVERLRVPLLGRVTPSP